MESGRLQLIQGNLGDTPLPEHFDRIFAVNVNLFWLKPRRELERVRNALAPGGRLYLFFEPPSRSQGVRAEAGCVDNLQAGGFYVERVVRTDLGAASALALVAQPVEHSRV